MNIKFKNREAKSPSSRRYFFINKFNFIYTYKIYVCIIHSYTPIFFSMYIQIVIMHMQIIIKYEWKLFRNSNLRK